MDAPSNGGLLYHEVQESKLCAVHCVNTVLQGPFFSEVDLAALASDLDQRERQVLLEGGTGGLSSADFLMEDSHNVSMGGDFSIQVLQKALEVWDLQVIPLDSPDAAPSKYDPELENGFICHLHDHWFCIRKVNGEWYNFNSLYVAPEHLSKFYLSAYLDTLKGSGWSIFLVRGNFPKECPMSSEASNFGQWLTPEDAQRMTKSCNQSQVPARKADLLVPPYSPHFISEDMTAELAEQEEQDLNAAIAASLMDSSSLSTGAGIIQDKGVSADPKVGGSETEDKGISADPKAGGSEAEDKGISADPKTGGSEAGATVDSSNLMDPMVAGSETSEAMDNKDLSGSASAVSEASIMSGHDKND